MSPCEHKCTQIQSHRLCHRSGTSFVEDSAQDLTARVPLRWAGALVMLGSHRVLPLAALTLLREGLDTVEILELRSDMEDCILRSIDWNELSAGLGWDARGQICERSLGCGDGGPRIEQLIWAIWRFAERREEDFMISDVLP